MPMYSGMSTVMPRKSIWGERKVKLDASLTPSSKQWWEEKAALHNCSGISDLLERVARGLITL
jgi:hypothetical protein